MKIIFSIASLGSGGAERVLSVLSKSLADSFDDVQYVMWEGGEAFYQVDERIKLVSLPELSGEIGRIKQLGTFRHYIKRENPDLILSFLTPYNILALASTIGLPYKIVVSERTDPRRLLSGGRPMLWLRDFMYKRANGILTQTEYAKSYYDVKFPDKTNVIYNPVLMREDQVGLGLKMKKKKFFVAVGRLEPVKNQRMMVEAFSKFLKYHPDYKLIIYGDGPEREPLEQFIVDNCLVDSINLAGRNENVWDAMSSAECFLLSSNYEGMSNAMIEALCLGLPVISTKVAGATDLIKNDVNGYLVDINDSEAMVMYMNRIANDDNLRNRLAANAVRTYELLRSDKICKQWVEYINEVAFKS